MGARIPPQWHARFLEALAVAANPTAAARAVGVCSTSVYYWRVLDRTFDAACNALLAAKAVHRAPSPPPRRRRERARECGAPRPRPFGGRTSDVRRLAEEGAPADAIAEALGLPDVGQVEAYLARLTPRQGHPRRRRPDVLNQPRPTRAQAALSEWERRPDGEGEVPADPPPPAAVPELPPPAAPTEWEDRRSYQGHREEPADVAAAIVLAARPPATPGPVTECCCEEWTTDPGNPLHRDPGPGPAIAAAAVGLVVPDPPIIADPTEWEPVAGEMDPYPFRGRWRPSTDD